MGGLAQGSILRMILAIIVLAVVALFVATSPEVAVKIMLTAAWAVMLLATVGGLAYDLLR